MQIFFADFATVIITYPSANSVALQNLDSTLDVGLTNFSQISLFLLTLPFKRKKLDQSLFFVLITIVKIIGVVVITLGMTSCLFLLSWITPLYRSHYFSSVFLNDKIFHLDAQHISLAVVRAARHRTYLLEVTATMQPSPNNHQQCFQNGTLLRVIYPS